VKVLSIEPYTPILEYELINDPNSVNNGTYRVISATGISGEVEIPATYEGEAVTEIGNSAFAHTTITSLAIPNGVNKIDGFAFGWNKNLTGVTIPKSVTNIGDAPFADCPNLTVITVDADNPSYSSEGGILYNKDKTTLIAYPSASSIGSITIPENVKIIGGYAFRDCYDLASVVIPAGVTSIGNNAFGWCRNIASITIPEAVSYVGWHVFEGWTALQTIYIKGHADKQSTIDAGWEDGWNQSMGEDIEANIVYQGN